VIITIGSSHEPQLMADWIKPGTHLACMGTDTKGKQEVDPQLVAKAAVFTDEVAQSVSIGECQHAVAAGLIPEEAVTPIGKVINGDHPGRTDDGQITLFDGTGVGLQDLAAAAVAAARALERGKAQTITL
jgi:alanine dehydrogenase